MSKVVVVIDDPYDLNPGRWEEVLDGFVRSEFGGRVVTCESFEGDVPGGDGPWGVVVRNPDGDVAYVAITFRDRYSVDKWIRIERSISPTYEFEPVRLFDAYEMRGL